MQVYHELSPIYDANSKVLILGSMPSVKSREVGFYYAHKTNRFWVILEKLFNVSLNTIEEKKKFLLENHISLWDVFEFCEIDASSDASIKNYKLNDINMILKYAKIKAIFCTGKKSYDTLIKNFKTDILYESSFMKNSPAKYINNGTKTAIIEFLNIVLNVKAITITIINKGNLDKNCIARYLTILISIKVSVLKL